MEEELEGLVTHLRNAKGAGLVDWLQKVNLNYYFMGLAKATERLYVVSCVLGRNDTTLQG